MFKAYYWKYIWATIRHKWFVFWAGVTRVKAPLYNLIVHDYSKFGPHEVFGYARHFYGDKGDLERFQQAWMHHQNTNPHHWEYWVQRTSHSLERDKEPGPIPMPEKYVKEMVADWFGAGKSYLGEYPKNYKDWTWFHKSKDRFNLHPVTWKRLEDVLRKTFNDTDIHL